MTFDKVFNFLGLFVVLGIVAVVFSKDSNAPAVLEKSFKGMSDLMGAAKH